MESPLSIRTADARDPETIAGLRTLRDAALAVDGQSAFNDQAMAEVAAGRRTLLVAQRTPDGTPDADLLGAAILGVDEFEFVISPAERRRGLGAQLLARVLAEYRADQNKADKNGTGTDQHGTDQHGRRVLAWSHGDHPGARALAERTGFTPVRTLLQLRRGESAGPVPAASEPMITAFRPGRDEAAWLKLNALSFARHPEQGRLTLADLESRMAEDWFSAENFLLAHGPGGSLLGFNWLKVEPGTPHIGEIYAIGVHPDSAGHGIGRRLMNAGLARLASIGATTTTLYVEADNTPAVSLYRSLGFTDHTIDVQYLRSQP